MLIHRLLTDKRVIALMVGVLVVLAWWRLGTTGGETTRCGNGVSITAQPDGAYVIEIVDADTASKRSTFSLPGVTARGLCDIFASLEDTSPVTTSP